jgi:hypothetical protein
MIGCVKRINNNGAGGILRSAWGRVRKLSVA